jgi:hypothetical protein
MTKSITVVKLGGTEGVDFSAICVDAAELLAQGQKLVLCAWWLGRSKCAR